MPRRKSVLSEVADRVTKDGPAPDKIKRDDSFRRRIALVGDISAGRIDNKRTRYVEPEKCRLWDRHNRIYDLLTPESCSDLISSIEQRGEQTVSAIVRPLQSPDGEVEYEIIAGARRHFSVSYLRNERGRDDILYRVEIHDLTDEDAFLLSDAENRDREDLSDYERACDYLRALAEYYGGEVRTMAVKLSVNEHWLHKYLTLAKLPESVIDLAPDVREWRRDHSAKIAPLVGKPALWKLVEKEIAAIRKLQEGGSKVANHKPLSANDITKRLLAAGNPKGRGAMVKEAKLALGEFGEGVVKVSSRKVTIDIPRVKGMDVDDLLARIGAEFK